MLALLASTCQRLWLGLWPSGELQPWQLLLLQAQPLRSLQMRSLQMLCWQR
jgi:hypothetical protein